MKFTYRCRHCEVVIETEKALPIVEGKEQTGKIYYKEDAYWKCPVCDNKNFLPKYDDAKDNR